MVGSIVGRVNSVLHRLESQQVTTVVPGIGLGSPASPQMLVSLTQVEFMTGREMLV